MAVCETCAEEFRPKPGSTGRFCSKGCYYAAGAGRKKTASVVSADCEQCGLTFTRTGRFCSHACYGESLRGPRVSQWKAQRMVTARDHPIAPPSGMVAVARLVLYGKVGPGEHRCHWCGAPVVWKTGLVEGALIADHLDWNRNNDDPANLVPSCHSCNAHRRRTGDAPLLQDDDLTMLWGGSRTRAVQRYCVVCGDAFLTIPAAVAEGKGLYCSRSCARTGPRVRRAALPPNPNGGSV